MISIVSIIINAIKWLLFKIFHYEFDHIIRVLRLPPRKVLRAHQLGLTLGLLTTLLFICLNHSALFLKLEWYTSVIISLSFIIGTILGGPFLVIIGVFFLLMAITDNPSGLWKAVYDVSLWYAGGYSFGAVFATLYNDIVYLHLLIFRKDLVKLAFAFDTDKKFNIIKSPDEREELAMLEALQPLTYFTQQILRNERLNMSITKVCSLIHKAYNARDIEDFDKQKLLSSLPEDGPNDIKQKLSRLKELLKSNEPDDLKELVKKIEQDIEPIVEKYLKLKDQKLYNYRLDCCPLHPYTIAFVANPKILNKNDDVSSNKFVTDPIIKDIHLFIHAISKALRSFETNEVLGRPEIWSRIRVVAIFDENWSSMVGEKCSLVQPYPVDVAIDDVAAHNLLAPVDRLHEIYKLLVLSYKNTAGFPDALFPNKLENINTETDIIFALSASDKCTRSTAQFTDYVAGSSVAYNIGKDFDFNFDPDNSKNNDIYFPTNTNARHEFYATAPGRVALNVIDAISKSYIHEFAHAMSSALNGAIVDEYFDRMDLKDQTTAPNSNMGNVPGQIPFYVNRIERVKSTDCQVIPVHKAFARYDGATYFSDRDHPSAKANWLGYFPDRKSIVVPCTMDRSYGYYHFDQLIQDFMYDRLIAKVNRPDK